MPATPHLRAVDGLTAFRAVLDLRTRAIAGWEVVTTAGTGLPVHWSLLEVALARRASTAPGQFVAIRAPAGALAGGRLGHMLGQPGSLAGLLVIATGPEAAGARAALARARSQGALVGVEPGPEISWRNSASCFDVVSVRVHPTRGHEQWSRALLNALDLGDKMGARILMDGIDEPERLSECRDAGVHLGQGDAVGGAQPAPPAPGRSAASRSVARELAERAPSVPASEPVAVLVDLSLADAENDWLVLVDGEGRPLSLVERAALLRGEPYERRIDVADPAATLASLARRAVQRPRADRSRPLAVCDDAGRYVGLLRMERLLEALAA
jgi:hypothetical protein